ncbi:MAG: SAM-dependent methyltransferase [Aestuariivirga sp.]
MEPKHPQEPALTEWLEALGTAVAAGAFVKLSVGKPAAAAADLKSVEVRPILVKRELKLSFTYHHKTRDIVKNYPLEEARGLLAELLTARFSGARLHTLEADVNLSRHGGHFVLARAAPSLTDAPELSHNRAKNRLVGSAGRPYLHALGLTDAAGNVLKSAQDKFRQINKYIEIVDGLIRQLPEGKPLRIVDMGAGKGYLTFALYDHLVNSLKREAKVVGVEVRADLVRLGNSIAAASGFAGLSFVEGSIAGFDCAGADVVIALHACDTATDDALAKAIKAEAALIVVAPCCHKQIRREMKEGHADAGLNFLLRFGTYEDRMAEMVTDGMRAQLLELSGYDSKLFEFVSDAHTPKNVMIVGRKLAAPRGAAAVAKITAEIAETKTRFGIGKHQLERLLGL